MSHFNSLAVVGRKFVDLVVPASIPTAGNVTYTAQQLLSGMILRNCSGAARSDTFPSGKSIIAALTISGREPVTGNSVLLYVRNISAAGQNLTLLTSPASDMDLDGTVIIPPGSQGCYLALVEMPSFVIVLGMGVVPF